MMNHRRRVTQWLSLGYACVSFLSNAHAQVNIWTNSAGGKWENSVNWSLGVAPASSQSVYITNGGSRVVTIDTATANLPGTMTVNDLTVAADPGLSNTLILENVSTNTPLEMPGLLTIGPSGVLLVTNAALVAGEVDEFSGKMSFADAALTTAGSFYVGVNTGTGELWAANSQFEVDAIWVGTFGMGAMTLSNGTVHAIQLTIGPNFGSSWSAGGTLTMVGTTDLVTRNVVIVNPSAWLWLNGGQLIATNSESDLTPQEVMIDGSATISNGTMLASGMEVSGTLTLAGGMIDVVTNILSVAGSSTCTGILWITGGDLIATNSPTMIGIYDDSGQVTVSNGTMQTLSIELGIASYRSQGTLTIAGGTTMVQSSVVVGVEACSATGTILVAAGGLYVTNIANNAVLEVRSGTLTQTGGMLMANILVVTNACGHFIHNGGSLVVGTLILDPNMSAVGDGIPNGWKQQYGLDPFDPNLGSEDADGDGMSNLQEYLAGTDPTNSASVFHITSLAATGFDISVTWTTGIGRTNALQATAGDASGGYSNAFIDIFTVTNAVGNQTNYLDLGAVTNFPSRFYRVRLVP